MNILTQNKFKKQLLICSLSIFFIFSVNILAAPPHPNLLERAAKNSNLSLITSKIKSMHEKGIGSPNKYPEGYKPKVMSSQKTTATGSFRALALMVEFSDNPSSVPTLFFDSLVFDTLGSTVRSYYKEVSYDQLDIITLNLPSSMGWNTAPQTLAYYVNGSNATGSYPQNSQRLVEDLVNQIDSLVDFSNYDNDDDGFVDVVMVIHSGSGAEFSGSDNDIWSHKWSTITPIQKDGVYVFNYTIQPEYWNTAGDMTIGVYAHELGHVFGLPDLYDTDYNSHGIGRWGVMSFGSWGGPGNDGSSPTHPCAWSKVQMGFVTPTNVTSNTSSVSISNVEQNPTIYRLWNSGASSTEYFLVENRQKLGYDSYIPGDGLLIWHIDESQNSNDNQWFPGENPSSHYLVALEQADGLFEIEQMNDYGDAGDPFPGTTGNTSFDGFNSPNSDSYVDGGTFVKVDNIQSVEHLIVANFTVGIAANIGDEINLSLPSEFVLEQNYPNPFNPKTSINFTLNRNAHATLNVYNMLGEKVNTIIDDNLTAGKFNFEWDAVDDNDNKLSSGIYLYRLKVGEQIESKKMVLLK